MLVRFDPFPDPRDGLHPFLKTFLETTTPRGNPSHGTLLELLVGDCWTISTLIDKNRIDPPSSGRTYFPDRRKNCSIRNQPSRLVQGGNCLIGADAEQRVHEHVLHGQELGTEQDLDFAEVVGLEEEKRTVLERVLQGWQVRVHEGKTETYCLEIGCRQV